MRRRDLLFAQWHIVLRLRLWFVLFAFCFAISFFQLHWPAPRFGIAREIALSALTATLFTVMAIVLTYVVAVPIMLARLRHTPGVLGEHLFEVSDDGLREVTDVGETRVAPGRARRLLRTRKYIIPVIRSRGAFVLPRRDFADSSAYESFWKALQPLVAAKKS